MCIGALSLSISHQHHTQAVGGLLRLYLGYSVGVALLNGGALSGQSRQEAIEDAPTWFRASGFGFRESGFGFLVSGSGFQVSGSEFRVPDFGFRVSDFWFLVSGSGF